MAIRVRCPNGHGLSVPDERAGVRVRCPKCKELFRADPIDGESAPKPARDKAAAPVKKKRPQPRPDDDDDDTENDNDSGRSTPTTPEERRKDRQRDKKVRLRKVSIGLLLHIIRMWGITLLIFFALLTGIFGSVSVAARAPNVERMADSALAIFDMIAVTCFFLVVALEAVVPLIGIVGSVFCCFIPKRAEARLMIISSIVFDSLALVISMFLNLLPLFAFELAKRARLESMLAPASMFCDFAGLFAFILYLKQTATYIKKPLLASSAMNLLAWLVAVVITGPLVYLGLMFLTVMIIVLLGPPLTVAALFLVIILWFAAFYYLWFRPILKVITDIRGAIEEVT